MNTKDFFTEDSWLELPKIRMLDYEDLGDDPDTHRWRVQIAYNANNIPWALYMIAHPVIRKTPCGVWIEPYAYRTPRSASADAMNLRVFHFSAAKLRFINNGSLSAWAKPTRKEAYDSFLIRLSKWKRIVKENMYKIEMAEFVLKHLSVSDIELLTNQK